MRLAYNVGLFPNDLTVDPWASWLNSDPGFIVIPWVFMGNESILAPWAPAVNAAVAKGIRVYVNIDSIGCSVGIADMKTIVQKAFQTLPNISGVAINGANGCEYVSYYQILLSHSATFGATSGIILPGFSSGFTTTIPGMVSCFDDIVNGLPTDFELILSGGIWTEAQFNNAANRPAWHASAKSRIWYTVTEASPGTVTSLVDTAITSGADYFTASSLPYLGAKSSVDVSYQTALVDYMNVVRTRVDVVLSKTSNLSSVRPGQAIEYTAVVSNYGPGTATFTFAESLHSSVNSRIWSGRTTNFGNSTASLPTDVNGTGALSRSFTLQPYQRLTINIADTIDPATLATSVVSTSTVTVVQTELNATNNNPVTITTPIDQSTIYASYAVDRDSSEPGSELNYTLLVTNTDSIDRSVNVTIPFKSTNNYVAAQWTRYNVVGTPTGGASTGVDNLSDSVMLKPTESVKYVIKAIVNPAFELGTLVSTASVSATSGISPGNKIASTVISIPAAAPIVAISSSSSVVVPGQEFTMVVEVVNDKAFSINSTLNIMKPTWADSWVWACTFTNSGSGLASTGSENIYGTLVLPPAAKTIIRITTKIPTDYTNNSIELVAQYDNNKDQAQVPVTATLRVSRVVDMVVFNVADQASVTEGDEITWTASIENRSTFTVTDVRFVTAAPLNVTNFVWTAAGTSGASGFTSAGSGDISHVLRMAPNTKVIYKIKAKALLTAVGVATETMCRSDAYLSSAFYSPIELFGKSIITKIRGSGGRTVVEPTVAVYSYQNSSLTVPVDVSVRIQQPVTISAVSDNHFIVSKPVRLEISGQEVAYSCPIPRFELRVPGIPGFVPTNVTATAVFEQRVAGSVVAITSTGVVSGTVPVVSTDEEYFISYGREPAPVSETGPTAPREPSPPSEPGPVAPRQPTPTTTPTYNGTLLVNPVTFTLTPDTTADPVVTSVSGVLVWEDVVTVGPQQVLDIFTGTVLDAPDGIVRHAENSIILGKGSVIVSE